MRLRLLLITRPTPRLTLHHHQNSSLHYVTQQLHYASLTTLPPPNSRGASTVSLFPIERRRSTRVMQQLDLDLPIFPLSNCCFLERINLARPSQQPLLPTTTPRRPLTWSLIPLGSPDGASSLSDDRKPTLDQIKLLPRTYRRNSVALSAFLSVDPPYMATNRMTSRSRL